MKKRSINVVRGIFSVFILLGLVNFVSAGIYFSELNSKYNFGDMVNLNVQVDPISEGHLLKVVLLCQGSDILTFNNLPDGSGNVNIQLPINFFTLNDMQGECYFSGDYAGNHRESMAFEISKRLNVRLGGDSFFANPGEEILITGAVERLNGFLVNGEVEITIPLLSILELVEDVEVEEVVEEEIGEGVDNEVVDEESEEEVVEEEVVVEEVVEEVVENTFDFDAGKFYGKVVGGFFSVNVKLPEDAPAGDYRIDVLAYEEASGQRSSEGSAIANLKVFQVLMGIDISLNNQNFNPGETLEFRPYLYDQTEGNIDEEISVILRDFNLNRIYEKIVKSQETVSFNIPTNLSSGDYELEASNGDLNIIKQLYVNEKAIVSFELLNNSLIVTNIGNIPYNQDIEVELNGKSFVKSVNLELGENKNFKLTGDNALYDVKVSDGENEIVQGGVMLTGNSINVNAIGEGGFSFSFNKPLIWIFLLVIFIIILLFLLRNILKKKSFAFHSNKNKKDVVEVRAGEVKKERPKEEPKGVVSSHNQANQVLVLKGNKNNAVVIALKIKNKLGHVEKDVLEKSLDPVYEKKGAVYEQGDFVFIIFSPIMTKTNKNEVVAARASEKIVSSLMEHNKKFREKIDFGIGINSGEVINKVEDGKLKFTALGNFIVVAKRLAEASDKQILVTKNSYEKGISEIKAEKRRIADGEVYEVRRVIDREDNKKFLSGFLERMKREHKE